MNTISPIHYQHLALKAKFIAAGIGQIVSGYSTTIEQRQSPQLGLMDCTCLRRIGFKGADTVSWLAEQGLLLAEQANECLIQRDQQRLLRLSATEFWLLEPFEHTQQESNGVMHTLAEKAEQDQRRVYPNLRNHSHACLYLYGELSAEALATLCAIDLREQSFANFKIAQTSMAKINAIVVRDDFQGRLGFYLLCDISLLDYLWPAILDAIDEYDGRPVGIDQLREMAHKPVLD